MNLSELKSSRKAVIIKVKGRGAFRKRISEMGFVKGKEIELIKYAPLKDPVEYKIMGYEVSLRKSEAELIEIITSEEALNNENIDYNGVIDTNTLKISAKEKGKTINVALVGNPNCGKTTLFNYATGAKEHVGNYSGVTVDAKKAKYSQSGYKFEITDLPGTYSLTAYSPEELYVRKHIIEELPDVVINVIDSSNLERNLYLTTRLIDLDIKVIVALNMYDELQNKGDKFNYSELGKMTGIPFVPTVAASGKGIKELFDKVIEVYEDREPTLKHIHINYGKEIENCLKVIQKEIKQDFDSNVTKKIAARFLALNLLEKDIDTRKIFEQYKLSNNILPVSEKMIQKIESSLKEDTETIITDARYGFINGALKETYKNGPQQKYNSTKAIDDILTHKLLGIPVFVFFMWLMFQGTFVLGSYPMDWIEKFVEFSGNSIQKIMPEGMLKDLLIDGIINGVGGVIVFLPNIILLFFFISIMEDTGYMARAAFLTDKVMHKIGLHGKSFIPLIMGFGCNVPAIMATRTLESRNDRLLTMLINPFMSCSARLPVYLVIIAAVFPEKAGTLLFLIYTSGIVISIIVAKIFKKFIFKSIETPFVMELPPYRLPVMRTTFKHMWHKASMYLKKMGGIILIASILIWALGYFPLNSLKLSYFDNKITQTENQYKKIISQTTDKLETDILLAQKDSLINEINLLKSEEKHELSYIGRIGNFIEPVIRPLGFDSKIGVSIIAGIAAKEIVVSTMGVLYGADTDFGTQTLEDKINSQVYKTGKNKGKKIFTPLTAISFMIFVLIYFPCIAVIAAIKKESGNWKWAAFTVFYTTALAWILSFIIYQTGSLFI
jgi:ferrous iron transport protein B